MYEIFKSVLIIAFLLYSISESKGQGKINFGLGGKMTLLDFNKPFNGVSTYPMFGLTLHFDMRLKAKLHIKTSFELNTQTVKFPNERKISVVQFVLPISLSYETLRLNKWTLYTDVGGFINHFSDKLDIETGDYNSLGYAERILSSNLLQDKYHLNYGSRLGISIKRHFSNNQSLNFQIHYARSWNNSYSVYYEQRKYVVGNGIMSNIYKRNTFDFKTK
ncbi:MAG: hypothetical protein IPN86_19870 [Saprospiraceae bacterium]|nr:hypothetical protein [Saprospiraceae bacterium]